MMKVLCMGKVEYLKEKSAAYQELLESMRDQHPEIGGGAIAIK